MHILYLDHSGDPIDVSQRHVVMAGISIFERQTHWISEEADRIAGRFDPADPAGVELHASPMMSGRGIWRRFTKADRFQALAECCTLLAGTIKTTLLFGAVIEKAALVKGPLRQGDIISVAFEEICRRFDTYLIHQHKIGNTQRGIIVLDKASYEQTIQNLAIDFKRIGRSWGVTRNLSEVPLFLDSKASRLVQLADVVAYALFRKYEKGEADLFNLLESKFDRTGPSSNGLYVLRNEPPVFTLTP